MISIEQAVFTSAQTDRSDGYQVVATSPGVCDADVRELTVWGPSHDALLQSSPGAASVNFHPLPSGNYCVGRTTPAGSEYSCRRGARVYTQCLVVEPEALARFANNPFALLKAVSANGSLCTHDKVPKRLQPLRLVGRAAVVNEALLRRVRRDPGPRWMATIVQAVLESSAVAVVGNGQTENVIAGLINCLPPECRTEFSFSTGLKLSSRRPFRLVALPSEADERRRAGRLYDLTVLDLSAAPPDRFAPTESWPRLIERVLESSRVPFLGRRLSEHRDDFVHEDLSAFGLQMLEELDAVLLKDGPVRAEVASKGTTSAAKQPGPIEARERPRVLEAEEKHAAARGNNEYRRGHEPHRQFQPDAACSKSKPTVEAPSRVLSPDSPAIMEKLERLDDLVYEALSGVDNLSELKGFWRELSEELGVEMISESRAQYLRYALTIWEKEAGVTRGDDDRQPARAVQALEVLCVLFNEA